jgi:hypothetical protein
MGLKTECVERENVGFAVRVKNSARGTATMGYAGARAVMVVDVHMGALK